MKFNLISTLTFLLLLCRLSLSGQQVWVPDQGDGTYKNPIIFADYSDPDICQVGDDFYMTSSSFNAIPGLPILHSTDLVNWTLINHALAPNVDGYFDIPQHGNGVWAPCIRYHEGTFYIYWGDPDRGIFRVSAKDPAGKWSAPVLVKKAYGNIDPSPLWDDDGKVYMVHAFAHSRAGIKSTLQVVELTKEGDEILDKGRIVVDGHDVHPTLEGPKFYKRNGYYYIFAPAGGVPTGWQVVFRSKDVHGPYEHKIVLAQGGTAVNGPHQGGWVELSNGESWFVHFQDVDEYGRIVHLQPVMWEDDWPVVGVDDDRDGIGEPVASFRKPTVRGVSKRKEPQTTDAFEEPTLGLQWQWNANPRPHWYQLGEGALKLHALYQPQLNLWNQPNVLTQKLPAPAFEAVTKMNASNLKHGEKSGLLIFGRDYAGIQVKRLGKGLSLSYVECAKADQQREEHNMSVQNLQSNNTIWLKVMVDTGVAHFFFSLDGENFSQIGESFNMKEGKWVGAKLALFATREKETGASGSVSFDWFKVQPTK